MAERTIRLATTIPPAPDVRLLALNTAAVLLADELLRFPSAVAAVKAAELLWDGEVTLPESLLRRVGARFSVPLGALVASPAPLVRLLPSRLRPVEALRGSAAARRAHALARERYRELQAILLRSSVGSATEPAAALVRHTFGAEGRQWHWAEAAGRVLDRVTALNRAALHLVLDLPEAVLDVLAPVLLAVAAPDFDRLAAALDGTEPTRDGALGRYDSLFAEMLGLAAATEVAS